MERRSGPPESPNKPETPPSRRQSHPILPAAPFRARTQEAHLPVPPRTRYNPPVHLSRADREEKAIRKIRPVYALRITHCFTFHASNALTSSLQKSGISSTTRPHTMLPSRKAALSTHSAPALIKSSLMPSDPVDLCPSQIPAEIRT